MSDGMLRPARHTLSNAHCFAQNFLNDASASTLSLIRRCPNRTRSVLCSRSSSSAYACSHCDLSSYRERSSNRTGVKHNAIKRDQALVVRYTLAHQPNPFSLCTGDHLSSDQVVFSLHQAPQHTGTGRRNTLAIPHSNGQIATAWSPAATPSLVCLSMATSAAWIVVCRLPIPELGFIACNCDVCHECQSAPSSDLSDHNHQLRPGS